MRRAYILHVASSVLRALRDDGLLTRSLCAAVEVLQQEEVLQTSDLEGDHSQRSGQQFGAMHVDGAPCGVSDPAHAPFSSHHSPASAIEALVTSLIQRMLRWEAEPVVAGRCINHLSR